MVTYIDNNNKKEIKNLIDYIRDEKTQNLGVDTETSGLDPYQSKVLLLQIGNENMQWVVNCVKVGRAEMVKVLNALNDAVAGLVFHNFKFDYKMIKANYGISLKKSFDTFIANKLCYAGHLAEDNSLAGISKKYLNIEMDKSTRSEFVGMTGYEIITKNQIEYAALDVKVLPKLKEILLGILQRNKLYKLYRKIEEPTIIPTAEIELAGVYLDKDLWLDLAKSQKEKIEKVEKSLHEVLDGNVDLEKDMYGQFLIPLGLDRKEEKRKEYEIYRKAGNKKKADKAYQELKKIKIKNESINFKSPAQIKILLNFYLKKISTKYPELNDFLPIETTGREILEKIDTPFTKKLVEHREAVKLFDTYGENFLDFINPITNRIHSNLNQVGTNTGRYSSKNPNLQNIPASQEYRTPFCVEDKENYRFISADFSAQELKLLIQLTKEPELIEALKNKKDLHSVSASILFNVPYEDFLVYDKEGNQVFDHSGEPEINEEYKKTYRNPCKTVTFGLIYGMSGAALARKLDLSKREGYELMEKYFSSFPKIKKTLEKFEKEGIENKCARSPLDERLQLLDNVDEENKKLTAHLKNICKNFPLQSTGASVTKLAISKVYNKIQEEKLDARIILTIHDEILVEVHKDAAERCVEIVETEMSEAFTELAPDVSMTVNAILDKHWIK